MKRFLFALFCASTSLYGSAVLVTDPTALNTTDFVTWGSQAPEASQLFFATTTDYESLYGQLANASAPVEKACASGCSFDATGGVAANDALLLVTGSATNSAAPVSMTFQSPMYGVGAYIEAANSSNADAGTTFTIRIQAFNGVNSVLSSTALVTSDGSGDPIFVGVSDLTQEITKVVFSLTDAAGNPVAGNFALDKLYVQDAAFQAPILTLAPQTPPDPPSVPEPAAMFLVGPVLGLLFVLKRRSVCA